MTYTILVTDQNLSMVGDPIDAWSTLDVTLRFNEPSSGVLTLPFSQAVQAQLQAGNRLVIIRDGKVVTSGPYEQSGYVWSAGDNAETLRVGFADDLTRVLARVTYPTPTAPASGAQGDYWSVSNVNAEVAMRSLVDANAGPSALVSRQVPHLVLGALAGVGDDVTYQARWRPMGDVLRELAIAGGGLGFRTVQVGSAIEFQVYAPEDRTGSVRFSRGLGNLRRVEYELVAPVTTAAIVGGQGELAGRSIVERSDAGAEAQWWRAERFVDQRQAADSDELEQAGDRELSEGAATAHLAVEAVDTADQSYGVHYGLGDIVTVVPVPGVEIADVVRAVRMHVDSATGAEYVTPIVGTDSASSDPTWLRRVRALEARLTSLESR